MGRHTKLADREALFKAFEEADEQSQPERGRDLLMRLAEDVKEIGQVESPPLQDGRNMVMLLGPTKAAGQQVETASA